MDSISQECNFLTRLVQHARAAKVAVVFRGCIDAYLVFADGQKLSFCPSRVDEQQLYVSINTYNRIIEAQDNDGVTVN